MKTIDNHNFKNEKALIRVDFNVPLDKSDFRITDDTRMRAALPTIKKIIDDGGSVILMSHLGRPKSGPEEKYSLKHIVNHLSELTGKKVIFADDCIGDDVRQKAKDLKPGEILLLENLRFYKEEEKGDEGFAKKLAEAGTVYVNDAFGTAHRAHASTAVIAKFFPEKKFFGYVMEAEIVNAEKILGSPPRPFTAIMGGAKVSDKIELIMKLMEKVDNLIIGGGMAFTFIRAKGGRIGASLVEEDKLDLAREIMHKAKEKKINLFLPVDAMIGDKFDANANIDECKTDEIPDGWMGLDIGPESVKIFTAVIKDSKSILWNGSPGVFEFDKFSSGTKAVSLAIAEATTAGAYSLIGGGDSAAAVSKFGMSDKVSYVSTGGGALLEHIEGKKLPGIAAIEN